MTDVFRYWAATIRHEESMTARPKAVRDAGVDQIDWNEPRGQHPYFKIVPDNLFHSWFMGTEKTLLIDLNDESRSYFSSCLRRHYYRQDRYFSRDGESPSLMMVGYPVFYCRRTDELFTLFRLVVSIE